MPLGGCRKPEEVAELPTFLVSPASSEAKGQVVFIDADVGFSQSQGALRPDDS